MMNIFLFMTGLYNMLKKIVGKFNGNLLDFVSPFCSYITLFVLLIYKKLKKIQILVVLNYVIGDRVYALSFWSELCNKYGKDNVRFVTSDKYKELICECYYPEIKNTLFLKHYGVLMLFLQCLIVNNHCSLIARKHGIINSTASGYNKYRKNSNLSYRIMLSEIYNLPGDIIDYPIIKDYPICSISKLDEIKENNKVCIINPYSNSMSCDSLYFEIIVDYLNKKGMTVYCNLVQGQKPIKGSIPLYCPIEELYSICKKIPLFISLRSGILDYLISTGIDMFVVYTNKGDLAEWISKHFSLDEWNSNGNIEEVRLIDVSDENEFISVFDRFYKKVFE